MVHVPVVTNVTRPDDELIVQTGAVVVENDFVPLPFSADDVDVIVGGVSSSAYDDTYEPESMLKVLEPAVIVKSIAAADADWYPPPAVIEAEIVHVPIATNATRPDDEFTVHTEAVELE